MKTLSWLHLSDWHQKGEDFDRSVVTNALLRDIRNRKSINSGLNEVDFIVFSGDVAFAGQVQEYEKSILEFFEPVLDAAGLDTADRLFIVPGNHDINWGKFHLLPNSILKPFSSREEVNEWLIDSEMRDRLLAPFEAYSRFVADYVNQDRGALSYKKQFSVNNKKIAIIGLNSALISGRNKDANGKINDYGHLAVGEPQIHELLADLTDIDLCIGILHHPFDWLDEFDRNRIEERMGKSCHFILCGHQHTAKANIIHGTSGDCLIIPAGASYFSRVAEDPRYTNGYNLVHIDFETNTGDIFLRKWSDRRNAWIEDIDSYPGGQFHFDLPKLSTPRSKKTRGTIEKEAGLEDFGSSESEVMPEAKKYVGGWFDAPQFSDQIIRTDLISDLHKLVASMPIVAVEGLSGSGKSYLVSSYLQSVYFKGQYSGILWYDPQDKDTLDNFLAHINLTVKLDDLSTISKCKELLHILQSQKILLVIDNFERVDQGSYSSFLSMSARYGAPAHLILISQIYIDLADVSSRIGRFELHGFDLNTLRKYFSSRGLDDFQSSTLQKLINKTDGLPLAASLFLTLIKDFGEEADDLLSDERLSSTRRLHGWFNKICAGISEDENRLLRFLSMCNVPFNMALNRMACRKLEIQNSYEVFENLQRTYLVKKYTSYRWIMHNLISVFCRQQLELEHKKQINIWLARHYLSRVPRVNNKAILSDDAFVWKIRAARHFQDARDFQSSGSLLQSLSRTVKARGHYETFIQLVANEISVNDARNTWLDYDYAHCCLIIGRVKESLRVLEPLVYSTPEEEQEKRLAVIRLYSEILDTIGKPEIALEKLREEFKNINPTIVHQTVLQQSKSIEVRLLIELGRYTEAEIICKKLLKEAIRRTDFRGTAVGLTYLGLINQLSGDPLRANKRFFQASIFFRKAEDIRGLSWSLRKLAICKLDLQQYDLGIKYLGDAIQIHSDIGECSLDYLLDLKAIKPRITDENLLKALDEELHRVSNTLSEIEEFS